MPKPNLDDHVLEKDLQDAVISSAMQLGWNVHHCRPARTKNGWATPIQGHPGFPDLVLARPTKPLFMIELKTQKGKLSKPQKDWGEILETVPGIVYAVVRPSNLDTLIRRLQN